MQKMGPVSGHRRFNGEGRTRNRQGHLICRDGEGRTRARPRRTREAASGTGPATEAARTRAEAAGLAGAARERRAGPRPLLCKGVLGPARARLQSPATTPALLIRIAQQVCSWI